MARYLGPKCKLARREGTDLFLKSARRSLDSKCKLDSKPGQHGVRSGMRQSDYGKQLREKQKLRRTYGILERQFRRYFSMAAHGKGSTGENLLRLLESRLDNVVYRMGFAGSRKAARQLVRHRHVEVNQKSVDIPSFLVQPGQEIRVRMKSREQASVMAAMDQSSRGAPLSWIAVDRDTFSGKMLERPTRPNIPIAAQEQLVVELYSK
jgi:small subunit ribosomal protein S4